MFVWSRLASSKWRDAWEERFHGLGQTNAVFTDLPGSRSFRLEVYVAKEEDARRIQKQFGGSLRRLQMENWAAATPPPARPLRVRGRLVVYHGGDEATAARLREAEAPTPLLHIPPDLAFGTGDHATTSTCLRLLHDTIRRHNRENPSAPAMADLGTGTGILALAARLWGASPVFACDFDPLALRVARKNARANQVSGISWKQLDITSWNPERSYNIVVANVFANVLIKAMPALHASLAPGGQWILSGILTEHWEDVAIGIEEHRLALSRKVVRGKWVTATGTLAA